MTTPSQAPARVLDAQFWSTLGIDYEHAYGNDPTLVSIIKKWLSHLPPSGLILECGCGTGIPIARTIADAGFKYHGIDVAEGMVDLCRKQVPDATYDVVNMLDLIPPKESEGFDGIVASFSHFELSPDEHKAMARKWFDWMKPDGYMLLSTITGEEGQDLSKVENFDAENECAPNTEAIFLGNRIIITVFTPKGWRKLLEDAGFQIVSTDTDIFRPKAEGATAEPRFYVIAKKN